MALLEAGRFGKQPIPIVTDREREIPHDLIDPDYSDKRFVESSAATTVFLDPGSRTVTSMGLEFVPGAHYEYDDRLLQKNHEAYQKAWEKASELTDGTRNARFYEEFLRTLYQNPHTKLVHILTGINRGNGFSYRAFGTIDTSIQPQQ